MARPKEDSRNDNHGGKRENCGPGRPMAVTSSRMAANDRTVFRQGRPRDAALPQAPGTTIAAEVMLFERFRKIVGQAAGRPAECGLDLGLRLVGTPDHCQTPSRRQMRFGNVGIE